MIHKSSNIISGILKLQNKFKLMKLKKKIGSQFYFVNYFHISYYSSNLLCCDNLFKPQISFIKRKNSSAFSSNLFSAFLLEWMNRKLTKLAWQSRIDNRYGTKIKNCSGFMREHRILKVWSLLTTKIIISPK